MNDEIPVKKNSKRTYVFVLVLFFAVCVIAVFAYRTVGDIEAALPRELLSSPMVLSGTKTFTKQMQTIAPLGKTNANVMRVVYDLQGTCLLPEEASTITLITKDNSIGAVHAFSFGKNCYNGEQTVTIPLNTFQGIKNITDVKSVQASIWSPIHYIVTIKSIQLDHTEHTILGASTQNQHKVKTFPKITPLRPSPYAAKSAE
ncbi:MAG: hypothetical protein HY430_03050 [Candidatus Levybacteria bacterium]|nr:hypothetical protein [Candidatus Levybacteria bacterium]